MKMFVIGHGMLKMTKLDPQPTELVYIYSTEKMVFAKSESMGLTNLYNYLQL